MKKALARRLSSYVKKFSDVPILVVGDIMLDRAIRGSVDRISPEAPVPVLEVQKITQVPGGAGNVICNLVSLGAHPTLVSVIGNDSKGMDLSSELNKRGVNLRGLVVDSERPTVTKTRVIAGQQQIIRLDVEKRGPYSAGVLKDLIKMLRGLASKQKGIILSDYGKGVVAPPVIKASIRESHRCHIPLVVDPKVEHFYLYKGVDCLTPNSKEAVEGLRVLPPKNENDFVQMGWKIVKKLNSRSLLITRGEKGMLLYLKGKPVKNIPTVAREVFDVTGAGDTVVATFGLSRALGAGHYESALIANVAAGLVVAKLGTASVTQSELLEALKNC